MSAAVSAAEAAPICGPLSEQTIFDHRELQLLKLLSSYPTVYRRPMDLGGTSGSNHSYRLNKLVKLNLIEKQPRATFSKRTYRNRHYRSWEYRITVAGLELITNG